MPTENGFTTTFDPSTVTEFFVNFASLGAMSKTKPGNVQGDIVDRDAAFSVRLYDPSTETMVYELSVYWHYKEGDAKGGGGDPCGGGGDEGKDRKSPQDTAIQHGTPPRSQQDVDGFVAIGNAATPCSWRSAYQCQGLGGRRWWWDCRLLTNAVQISRKSFC